MRPRTGCGVLLLARRVFEPRLRPALPRRREYPLRLLIVLPFSIWTVLMMIVLALVYMCGVLIFVLNGILI